MAAAAAAAGPFGFCFSTIIKLSSLLAGNSTAFVVAAADAANGASSAEVGFKGRPVTSGVAAGLADGSGTTAGAAAGFGEWPFVAGSGILGARAGFGCSLGTSGLMTGAGAGAGTSTLGFGGSTTTGLGTSTGLGSGIATGLGGAGLTGASTLGAGAGAGCAGVGVGFAFGGSSTGLGRSWTPEGLVLSTGFWATAGLGSSCLVDSSDSDSHSGCSIGASVRAGELLEISLPVKNIKIRLIKLKRFLISSNASEKYQSPNMASSGISIYLSINSRFFVIILAKNFPEPDCTEHTLDVLALTCDFATIPNTTEQLWLSSP